MLTNKFKINYSIGAIPNGIKTDTFTFFLLFFYSNIIGLNPGLAGSAIFIALCVDAFTDPLMGTISDRTNSSFGRRHPYMFISFIPMSLGYIFLFAPRQDWDMSQNDLFVWMTIFTILTRIGMTLFDIPHRAFGGEVTKNYEERTLLMSWREMIAWVAGLSNAFLGYGIFFASTPEYPQGQLNPDAWLPFAITGAIVMVITVLYSSFSTKNQVKSLSKWSGSISLGDILKELKIALGNKSFLIFFFGYLFIAVSWGLNSSLQIYMNTYFWEFKSIMIASFLGIYVLSTFTAFLIVPRLVLYIEKRAILLIAIAFAALVPPIPIILFINGILPESGSWNLFYSLVPFIYIANTCLSSSAIIRESMLGDISDEVELDSKIGQQGLMFASSSLIGKLNTGFGILVAGIALELISFPQGSEVSPNADQIFSLAMVQGPLVAVLMIIPFGIFSLYKINRKRHEYIISQLELR